MHINQIETRPSAGWSFEILSLDTPCLLSRETCTMMHELMLISLLTQSPINYYIFILYYVQT